MCSLLFNVLQISYIVVCLGAERTLVREHLEHTGMYEIWSAVSKSY